MKLSKMIALGTLVLIASAATAPAQMAGDTYQEQTAFDMMLHKLGRGIVNVFTCWVEIPRNIAIEWEKTDPATGFVVGTIKGFGWGFARLATGVYDTFTFPVPVPANYQAMIEPEFVVTDVWGDPIPGISEFGANDPNYPDAAPIYPRQFDF